MTKSVAKKNSKKSTAVCGLKKGAACCSKDTAACSKGKGKKSIAFFHCNIGWGNTLFIRGEGAKLNWVKGVALTYDEAKAVWVFETHLETPLDFKVLINDVQWNEGDNLKLTPGQTQTFEPQFI